MRDLSGIIDGGIVGLVWYVSRLLAHPRNPWRVLDWPNARSLHAQPVPRMGGIAIAMGVVLGSAFGSWHFSWRLDGVLGALALVAVLSWYDDRHGLSPSARLLGHSLAALIVAWVYVQWPNPLLPQWGLSVDRPVATILMALFLVWWINLYNFMDGMDGFAGGMAVSGFGMLALLGYGAHDLPYAEIGMTVACAALGFTISNFPPARLFMGDMGATTLGFGAGIMILAGAQRGDFPVWVGLIVFSPFLVDATVTLIRRLARGASPTTAHREHYYQRIVQLGFGHRRTVLGEYALMAVCALCAWVSIGRSAPTQWAILAFLAALYGLLGALVKRREGYEKGNGKAAH
ncbi:MAG: glycosyltransferase family 4 protein [Acidiferrobacter sp.]